MVTQLPTGINLEWGPIFWTNANSALGYQGNSKITYTVVATKDSRARLDSQCVLRKEVASKHVLASFEEQTGTEFLMKSPVEGQTYFINVIAKIEEGNKDTDYFPYQPIEVKY